MTFFLQLLEAAKAADDASLRWVNGFVGQAPLFDTLINQLVHSDLFKVGVLVAALYWLWFRTDGDVAWRRHRVMTTIPCAAVAIALGRFLAASLPFRTRPYLREELHWVAPPDFHSFIDTWSAFPSDTAMFAGAVATSIWLISRRLGTLAWLYVVIVVCLPRWYTGLHHPSDLIVGGLIGLLIPPAMLRIGSMHRLTDPLLKLSEQQPAMFQALVFLLMFELSTLFSGVRELGSTLVRAIH